MDSRKARRQQEEWREDVARVRGLHGRACDAMDGSLKDLDRALASAGELEEAIRPLGRQGDTEEIRSAVKALRRARDEALKAYEVLADRERQHHELLMKAGELHDGTCSLMDAAVSGLSDSVDSVRRLERAASEGLPGRFRAARALRIPAIKKALLAAKDQLSRTVRSARAAAARGAPAPQEGAFR